MLSVKCPGAKIQSIVSLEKSKGVRNSVKKHEVILFTRIISLMLNQLQFLESGINFSNAKLPERGRKSHPPISLTTSLSMI